MALVSWLSTLSVVCENLTMYILDFLKGFSNLQQIEHTVFFEYRLLCSGELYNSRVVTTDWRKSDGTRILIDSPFTLSVCSHPFNEFPQELALRFSVPQITEKHGQKISVFYPDEEIARDLSAILTLLCRRLITVAAKIREGHQRERPDESPFFQDWPIGFVKSLNPKHWEYKPSIIEYGLEGISGITDYNPPPLGIDPIHLKCILESISHQPFGESLVLSARLYSLALQQLEKDIDIAYQLLIATIETIANEVLKAFVPSEKEMIDAKSSVANLAQQFGLSEDQASQMAIVACKDNLWSQRKFIKFIIYNATDDLWKEDDLFKLPTTFLPQKEDFEAVLKSIYRARGKFTHRGYPFPPSSIIGVGPTAPSRVFMSIDWSKDIFPPVVWFERVVSNALNLFVERSLQSGGNKDLENPNPSAT
jgi:hypothetical protein